MPVESLLSSVHVVDKPFHELLLNACDKYLDDIAVIDGVSKESFTYISISSQAHAFASYLHHRGFVKGDTLALCLFNCPQFIPVIIGSMMRGVIPALINTAYTKHELPHFLKDCGARMVVTQPDKVKAFTHAIDNCKNNVNEMIVFNMTKSTKTSRNVKSSNLSDILMQDIPHTPKVTFYTQTDIAILPYSSGTSGVSKGVMLSHYSLSFTYHTAMSRAFFLWPTRSDHEISILPFYHMYGSYLWQFMILEGVPIVTMPRFDPAHFLQVVQDYKVRMLHLVPPILVLLAKHPIVDQYDLTNLQILFTGAAPTGKDLSLAVVKRLPNVKYLLQSYGMSEHGVSLLSPATPIDKVKFGSAGVLAPNTYIKIVDPDTGVELEGPDKEGEICVKSGSVMLGYWQRPKQTADTIDNEGWLHTGDIGYYDDEGDFYIVDRLKELIKVKGIQVAPAELEDILHRHRSVADCAVIGVSDERLGEAPSAFVVLAHNSTDTAQNIMSFVNDQVAEFKKIRSIKIVLEIPKSASGKILRRTLRDLEKKLLKSKI